jgi:hypothetical protein
MRSGDPWGSSVSNLLPATTEALQYPIPSASLCNAIIEPHLFVTLTIGMYL